MGCLRGIDGFVSSSSRIRMSLSHGASNRVALGPQFSGRYSGVVVTGGATCPGRGPAAPAAGLIPSTRTPGADGGDAEWLIAPGPEFWGWKARQLEALIARGARAGIRGAPAAFRPIRPKRAWVQQAFLGLATHRQMARELMSDVAEAVLHEVEYRQSMSDALLLKLQFVFPKILKGALQAVDDELATLVVASPSRRSFWTVQPTRSLPRICDSPCNSRSLPLQQVAASGRQTAAYNCFPGFCSSERWSGRATYRTLRCVLVLSVRRQAMLAMFFAALCCCAYFESESHIVCTRLPVALHVPHSVLNLPLPPSGPWWPRLQMARAASLYLMLRAMSSA